MAVIEHRGRDEAALRQLPGGESRPAGHQTRSLRAPAGDEPQHLLQVLLGNERAHLGGGIERVADAHGGNARAQPLDESGVQAPVHEHAGAVRAHLARGIEIPEQCARDGILEARVAEHDEGRLAAELERHLLEEGRGVRQHGLARAHLPGERDLAYVGMAGEETPGLGPPLHDLEDSLGHSRARVDLGELDRREGRQLGRLEDHRVAAGERRRGFPAGDLQRVVPRTDPRHDTERLAARVAEGSWAEIEVLSGNAGGQPAVVLQALRTREHVHRAGLLDRLAGVARLELGELVVPFPQHPGRALQDAPALGARERGPLSLRGPCPRDRGIDLLRAVRSELREQRARGGVDRPESVARTARLRGCPGVRALCLGLRELPQPAFDERREEGARGLAVSLLPLRQRGAQPHSIDHGGDHRREAARLLARDHPAQIAAQVRQHATLVSGLHPLQAAHVQHLAPEREPRGAGALVEFLRREIGVDDRLHPCARSACLGEPRAHTHRERARQRPKGRFQQSVLVAEVMRDQSGRDPGTPRDLREGRADVADFGETVDRDLDELDSPGLLSLVVRGGGAVMHEFLERG